MALIIMKIKTNIFKSALSILYNQGVLLLTSLESLGTTQLDCFLPLKYKWSFLLLKTLMSLSPSGPFFFSVIQDMVVLMRFES